VWTHMRRTADSPPAGAVVGEPSPPLVPEVVGAPPPQAVSKNTRIMIRVRILRFIRFLLNRF
jgi:hypothetical protein